MLSIYGIKEHITEYTIYFGTVAFNIYSQYLIVVLKTLLSLGILKTNYLFVYLLIYIAELWVSRSVNGSFKSTQRPSGVAAPKKEATSPGTKLRTCVKAATWGHMHPLRTFHNKSSIRSRGGWCHDVCEKRQILKSMYNISSHYNTLKSAFVLLFMCIVLWGTSL